MDEIAHGDFRIFELPVTIACDGSKQWEHAPTQINIDTSPSRSQEGDEHAEADRWRGLLRRR